MPLVLSPLYPILDASYLPGSGVTAEPGERANPDVSLPGDLNAARRTMLASIAHSLAIAGVTMMQYRNKHETDMQVLRDAIWLRSQAPPSLRIILNDRVHLARQSNCNGVHLGQTDLSPEEARSLLGGDLILGLSTHNQDQVRLGDQGEADYLAIGPVYATGSKLDAEAAVGFEGVRQARALTRKPLVAIGGITLARAAEVRAAGADSLAVISALFGADAGPLEKLCKDFLQVFR